ncbi:ribosomal protein S8A [Glugoides intestinalis]
MGINNSGNHKRTKSGAKLGRYSKKRKNRMGRQPSNTRVGETRVREVRVRGGNIKLRALRLNSGNFKLITANFTADTDIEQVVYHPSSNELMRTNTLTKSSVVKINSQPFLEELKKTNADAQDKILVKMAEKGFFLAIITTRPGQEGQANGYILQGEELEFYQQKLKKGKILV